jgi:hypothetical protein
MVSTPHNYRVNLSAGGSSAATVTRAFARRRLRVRYGNERPREVLGFRLTAELRSSVLVPASTSAEYHAVTAKRPGYRVRRVPRTAFEAEKMFQLTHVPWLWVVGFGRHRAAPVTVSRWR